MNARHYLQLACSAGALLFSSEAFAQARDDSPADNLTSSVADIIVTAGKRSEALQDVPAAVSVVDNARLTQLGVTTLTQITNLSTGVSVAAIRSRANVYIRGVGQTLVGPNADANVALNLNGVYLVQSMAATAFFDVDRIEILPGPQGTLYGRNSTGGVVNITSRTPGDQFGVDGFVELGKYNHVQLMAGIDTPVTDTLSSRTAGTYTRHDGYISNGEDDDRTSAIRETLVWHPGTATKVAAVAGFSHTGGVGDMLMNIPDRDCGYRCAHFDPKALGFYSRVNVFQGSLTIEQQLGDNATLTYIGGYSDLDQKYYAALAYGPPVIPFFNPETAKVISQEARINVTLGKLQGIVGAYYFHEKADIDIQFSPTPAARLDNPFSTRAHGAAVYGQGTYSLTDDIRITGGLRYSRNIKSIDGFNAAFSAATGALLFKRPYVGHVSMNRVDWKGGLEFDVGPHSMLYANVASGFTPGGFSSGPQIIGQLPAKPFKPTTLIAYVGGIKNRFADGLVTLNVEGFYYDYKNYQLSARDILTGQNLVYNADKSTVYGVQMDSRFRPTPNDDFSLNATYVHAVANILVTPSGSFNGVVLPFSPHWTVNAYYQHAFDVGHDAQIRANANFKYTSGRWTLYTRQDPGFYQKRNTHTDLNLGYFASRDRWSIQLYVRNLEDKLVKAACGAGIPGPAACYFEPPRTYGATLGFKL